MRLTTKVEVGAWALLVVINPLVITHVNDGINWVFDNLIIANSGIVMFVAVGVIGVIRLISYRKANKVNVPHKTAKTKTMHGAKYELAPVK